MARRPLIGITGPDHGGLAAWLASAWAVRRAGGRPVRITPRRSPPREPLAGLVIGGGADVAASLYGEETRPVPSGSLARSSRRFGRRLATALLFPFWYLLRRLLSTKRAGRGDPDRDALETRLFNEADAAGIPVLGICRGAQLLNVCRGGTLYQELAEYYVEFPQPQTVLPTKDVEVLPGSRLAAVLGRERCRVNSLHRQAVRTTGRSLAVVGREPNGVVQAIEDPDRPYLIGVQWHPEYLPQHPEQRRLFAALVEHARFVEAGARIPCLER
jgi:putative glutamine amidotransferase